MAAASHTLFVTPLRGALQESNTMSSGDLILGLYGIGTILGAVYTCILVRERYRNMRD